MKVVFVTGGNKGLGYESAKRLIALGYNVYIGARSVERGEKAAQELGAKFIQIDVSNDDSVIKAFNTLYQQVDHLDVLINNAGVAGVFKKPQDITSEDMEKVFNTNVYGIVRVTNAFTDLLNKSSNPVIVNVSSGLGSFGLVTDDSTDESKVNSLTYSSSKAAVSMLTVQYAKALKNMKVNCVDPGATATNLNGKRGKQTVTEGTDAIIEMATINENGPTGTFVNRKGKMPW